MITPMRFDTIVISRHGPVAEIRLNRPAGRNPIDQPFLAELDAAAAMLHDDDRVSVVLLSAAGEAFSAGARAIDAVAVRRQTANCRSAVWS